MLRSLVRFAVSVALGIGLALPLMRLMPALAPVAVHAQDLSEQDLLPADFADATGLGQGNVKQTIGSLIKVALSFLGVIAICIVLYGGFKWMVASGNDEKVAEAKRLLIAGVVGLAIVLAAYAITSFVISAILGATQ